MNEPGGPAADIVVRLIPAGTVLLAILLLALPAPLAWGVLPQLPLLFTLIWASLQPRGMPAWAALLLGILTDLVTGVPLGINAFILPAAVVLVRIAEARTEMHSLFVDWLFAGVVVLAANLVMWQMLAFTGRPAPLAPIMGQAALTILAWPAVVRITAGIQRRIVPG